MLTLVYCPRILCVWRKTAVSGHVAVPSNPCICLAVVKLTVLMCVCVCVLL